MSNSLAPKLLAELIGTFALVFIGAGAASIVGGAAGLGGITAVAFAHGLTLMVVICAYGRVSGGHMNPAVTVGVLAVGAITAADAVGYILSQIVGGVAAALLLRIVLGGVATGLGTPELAHGLVLGGTVRLGRVAHQCHSLHGLDPFIGACGTRAPEIKDAAAG